MTAAPAQPDFIVFYDGLCRFCTESRRSIEQMTTATLRFINIRDDRAMAAYPMIDPVAAMGQMHVLSGNGTVTGGFDALVTLMPSLPLLRPFAPLLGTSMGRAVGSRAYRWVAKNRFRLAGAMACDNGVCAIHR